MNKKEAEARIKAELKKEAMRKAAQIQKPKGKLGSLLKQANGKRN